ncbi:MAG: hypothetical protein E7351_02470 [Clostridiales bacterium]|nr:hypothetical protein [Clostridiales bacterium]
MTKIVCFDYDGTLTVTAKGTSSWVRAWEKLGALDTDEKLFNMFYSGEINEHEWLSLIVQAWRDLGADRRLFSSLAKQSKLIKDISYVFKYIHDNGIKIYVLSAGIKNIIDENLAHLMPYITEIQGYELLFDDDGIVNDCKFPRLMDNKHETLMEIMEKENVSPEEILFVGNGKSDDTVYLSGVRTLCLNPDDADIQDQNKWQNVIESDSLKTILSFLDINAENKLKLF